MSYTPYIHKKFKCHTDISLHKTVRTDIERGKRKNHHALTTLQPYLLVSVDSGTYVNGDSKLKPPLTYSPLFTMIGTIYCVSM